MNQSVMQQTRATETERTTVTPLEGELLYTTDEKKLYVGDGSTAGGILVTGAPFITEDMTLNVPADYADINDALDYLANFRISNKAVVTIQVSDGDYTYTETILINHPDAAFIEIIGNETTPSSCKIWNPVTSKIVAIDSCHLGKLSGFEIDGQEDQTNYPSTEVATNSGILLNFGAEAAISNVSVKNCHYGIVIQKNSVADLSDISITSCTSHGLYVAVNSAAYIYDTVNVNNNENGIYVTNVSSLKANYMTLTVNNNTTQGLNCNDSSNANVKSQALTGNGSHDILVSNMGFIYATGATYGTTNITVNTVSNHNSYIRV